MLSIGDKVTRYKVQTIVRLLCAAAQLWVTSHAAFAAVPAAVADAQSILASGLNYPEGVAVSNQGLIYVADTNNNRIISISEYGVITRVSINGYTLNSPGTELDPTQTCGFSVVFAPTTTGAENEVVTSTFNTATQVQLTLSGTATDAQSQTASHH